MQLRDDVPFKQALRALIDALNYKQTTLARLLNVNPSTVSRWISGKATPSREQIARINAILNANLGGGADLTGRPHELYVSAPIVGLTSNNRIGRHHAEVTEVIASADRYVDNIYWPGLEVSLLSHLKAPDLMSERNLRVLFSAPAFLYIQLAKVTGPTSALIELGIALGLRKRTTIIIREDLVRPFLLQQGFEGLASSLGFLPKARLYPVASAAAAAELIERNGRELFGLSRRPADTGSSFLPGFEN